MVTTVLIVIPTFKRNPLNTFSAPSIIFKPNAARFSNFPTDTIWYSRIRQ